MCDRSACGEPSSSGDIARSGGCGLRSICCRAAICILRTFTSSWYEMWRGRITVMYLRFTSCIGIASFCLTVAPAQELRVGARTFGTTNEVIRTSGPVYSERTSANAYAWGRTDFGKFSGGSWVNNVASEGSSFGSYGVIFDTITISGRTGNGTLRLVSSLDAFVKCDTPGQIVSDSQISFQSASGGTYYPAGGYRKSAIGITERTSLSIGGDSNVISFTYGTPLSFAVSFSVSMYSGYVPVTADIDAAHTGFMNSLKVFDDSGAAVHASVSSASGFQYQVVPEPATLVASGVGLLALARRRKHSA
jgi:hypothetical protein